MGLIAEKADVSLRTISQIRTGARHPSDDGKRGCAGRIVQAVDDLTGGKHVLAFPPKAGKRAAKAKPIRRSGPAKATSKVPSAGDKLVFRGAKGCRVDIGRNSVTITLL